MNYFIFWFLYYTVRGITLLSSISLEGSAKERRVSEALVLCIVRDTLASLYCSDFVHLASDLHLRKVARIDRYGRAIYVYDSTNCFCLCLPWLVMSS